MCAMARQPSETTVADTPSGIAQQIRSGELGDLENIVCRAIQFREQADRLERQFIIFVMGVEESDIWRELGDGTFISFINYHKLCDPQRYVQGRAAIQCPDLPRPVIDAIGMPSAKLVVNIPNQTQRREAINTLLEKAESQGHQVSERVAREVVRQYAPRPPPENRGGRMRELEAENAALRDQIAQRDTRIAELEAMVISLGGNPNPRPSRPRRDRTARV